jgi:multicomponent K+:H+ antiporter subunit G
MNQVAIALWAQIVIAVLVLAGAALALLGSIGLLRLPTFFERVHAPAIIAQRSPSLGAISGN